MGLRVYLTGRVTVESPEGEFVVTERDFRGKQARLAFAYLALERVRSVTRDELVKVIWPDEMPPSWEGALSSIASRLRGLLETPSTRSQGLSLTGRFGQYQLQLPDDTWVDVEAGADAVDEAEGAMRAGDPRRAFNQASVAVNICRRPFLPGIDSEWVDSHRSRLERQLLRALDVVSHVWIDSGEPALAVETASEAIRIDAFRESSYRLLLQAHAAAGNQARVAEVYNRLKSLLADELNASPTDETEALYRALTRTPVATKEAAR